MTEYRVQRGPGTRNSAAPARWVLKPDNGHQHHYTCIGCGAILAALTPEADDPGQETTIRDNEALLGDLTSSDQAGDDR